MFNSASSVAPLYVDVPRPFLKWAGGKGRLLEQYRSHFPRYFETYYEPFLGGGAVFFHLLPPRSLLTDINPELVNVYRCVRDQVEEVIALLREHERSHSQEYYYQIRSMLYCNPIERAARLIYLNRTCKCPQNNTIQNVQKEQQHFRFKNLLTTTRFAQKVALAQILL
ncbi:Dam family site-specific DNA-(adenine-N6)-methyltransferase [Oscillatoria sp. FACHB-1407]|uniref:DNA adenine methylase n=1 Tax=Oscillatoria sp. FACHB-1407 TaxID=2692847 RepID=UPI001684A6D9|nr:Dam family site-specific DNA-(adenine-N6)-methyltransferase [Oscillatoria sp. FACHB-1407]MBD2463912.1 Dam family site-specific DNA-(adenine-N6)-methyltransferase [Oscillatoria sp. FACHB-1407]